MKILCLLESTSVDESFLYYKALVESLAGDGYDPSIVFTSRGTPSDHSYQLVKQHVVHHLTKLCFRSREDADYINRLAAHIDKHEYDCLIVSQSDFPGFTVPALYDLMERKPRLIFLANQCSQATAQAAGELSRLSPVWASVSQNIATRFLPEHDVQVIYGPAVQPETLGVDIRAELGIKREIRLVGYMGNVDDINMEPVLEAVKRLKCGLLIAGSGDKIAQLAELRGPVKVIPSIPQCRGDWFRAIDCFVYPARLSGFPMLPLEAAMCKCPVAMTPVSDMYQLCQGQEGFGFFTFRPEEVIKAIQDATSCDREAMRGWVSEQFSPEKFLSGWQILLS